VAPAPRVIRIGAGFSRHSVHDRASAFRQLRGSTTPQASGDRFAYAYRAAQAGARGLWVTQLGRPGPQRADGGSAV